MNETDKKRLSEIVDLITARNHDKLYDLALSGANEAFWAMSPPAVQLATPPTREEVAQAAAAAAAAVGVSVMATITYALETMSSQAKEEKDG